MPKPDSTALAALAGPGFAPAWFIYLDISGDPVRVTNFGQNRTFASTGDTDLDGNTFTSFGGSLLSVTPVANSESGSDTVTVELSGILGIDTTLLNEIGNRSLWQGRACRIWFEIYDVGGTAVQGAVVPHYKGYMTSVEILDGPKTQTIRLMVELYLSVFNQPSNRSLLSQKDYDPADTSAAATMASANGARHVGGADTGGGVGGGGGAPRSLGGMVHSF